MDAIRTACGVFAISAGLVFGLPTQRAAAAAPRAKAAAVAPEEKQKIAALRATAMGEDRLAAHRAFMELVAQAEPARPTLVDTLRVVLVRDRGLIEENLRRIASGGDLKKVEADVAGLRKTALARIERMTTPADANAVRGDYAKTTAAVKRLNDQYAARSLLIDIARHRPDLLGLWKDVAPKTAPNPIDPAIEQKLAASVLQALGERFSPILKDLQARKLEPNDPLPNGIEQAGLYYYRLHRKTEAYNKSLAPLADPAEAELVRLINGYRDVLGLPPLEMDARLLQAARRHSKEMVDLKYFAAISPTEENKDALTRLKNAGVTVDGEWSEALGRGTKTATQTFWAMFDQPPYHKGMTSSMTSAIGVGKWDQYWTIEIATTPRLIFASAAERAAAQVAGSEQPPQATAAASAGSGNRGAGQAGDSGNNRIPNTGGANQVPSIPAIPGLGGF